MRDRPVLKSRQSEALQSPGLRGWITYFQFLQSEHMLQDDNLLKSRIRIRHHGRVIVIPIGQFTINPYQ